jgi:hypothetical protein
MIEIKDRVKGVTDKEKWVARRTSFVAKVQATKVVWFPPKPAETGKKAASTTKKSTKRAAKKTTGAAKKTAKGTKKVADPRGKKKT